MHYYQFNIGDYAKSTLHLTPYEDIAYRRLLDLAYDTEKPIPADIDKVVRLIRMREHKTETQQILDEFFYLTKKGYFQKRVKKEIDAYSRKVDAARANGRLGGRPKKTQLVNLANPAITQAKAKQEPLTNNHKPLNKEIKTSSSGDDGVWAGFFIFWDEYPKKVGKKDAIKAWNKLKPTADLIDRVLTNVGARLMAGHEKQFWPNPATYLNGERWEDEIIHKENSNGTRKSNSKPRLESLNGQSNHDWRDPNNARRSNH